MTIRAATAGGPQMSNLLSGFFDQEVTIVRATNTLNEYGEPIPSWSPLADHCELPALVAGGDVSVRLKRQEFRTSQTGHEMLYKRVLLKGNYTKIDHADRCRIDGVDWSIISIVIDVTRTFTELLVESIEPGNV